MILTRLFELAQRENLSQDPAFARSNVKAVIVLAADGSFLNLLDVRGTKEVPSRKRGAQPKIEKGPGLVTAAPIRPVVWDESAQRWKLTDPAANGKERPAVFLVETIARVLPVTRLINAANQAKCAAQRSTFWRFLKFAAQETQDEGLKAAAKFGEQLDRPDVQEQLAAAIEQNELGVSDLCTIRWHPDAGGALAERHSVKAFWRDFFENDQQPNDEVSIRGFCQVTGTVTEMKKSVSSRVRGLMSIDCRALAYFVTQLNSAESYGLEGAASAMISPRGLDTVVRALEALVGNQLSGRTTSRAIGKLMLLFWTRQAVPVGMESAFDPTPESVAALLANAERGVESHAATADEFYLLALTGNSARIVVREYLETTLPKFQENLAGWFRDLRIADSTKDGMGQPTSVFPMWLLSGATALDADHVTPELTLRLTFSAIRGDPVPLSVLSACLGRLRAEGRDGFRTARLALLKLTLLRRNIHVTEVLNQNETDPAYICGRLLSVFEQIQYAALGDVNANVVDKYFGTFSSAPGMVLGRLYANAQNHLRKIRSEKPGTHVSLDQRLSQVSAQLSAPPKGQLSLVQQGLFALGYYHQKAHQFQEIAARKAASEANSASNS